LFKKIETRRIFYGWFIVAACFIIALNLGGVVWTFGVFFKPIENEFGWSRTLISSGYTAFLIGHAISIMLAGRLVDRYPPRLILLISAVIGGLGVALGGMIHSVGELRFYLFLAGMGTGANWSVPMATIQRWFFGRKRAGLALAVGIAGIGSGALVFAPFVSVLIQAFGWRIAYFTIGIIFFVTVSLSALVTKSSPAMNGNMTESRHSLPDLSETWGWTTRKAIITPTFLAVIFQFCVSDLAFNVVTVHLVPYVIDTGISATAAATALGFIGGISVPGRLTGGFISEHISWQKVLIFSSFGMSLAFIWLILLNSTWMLSLFVVMYGVFMGIRAPSQVGILSDYFGTRALGELIGITGAASVVVGAAAPYIAGFIYDTTGSYFWAFVMVVVALISAGVVAYRLRKPALPTR